MPVGQCLARRTHNLAPSILIKFVQDALAQGFEWLLFRLCLLLFSGSDCVSCGFNYSYVALAQVPLPLFLFASSFVSSALSLSHSLIVNPTSIMWMPLASTTTLHHQYLFALRFSPLPSTVALCHNLPTLVL